MRDKYLPKAAEEAKKKFEAQAKGKIQKGHCGGLTLDGYKNVSSKHVESIMLSVGGVSFPIGLESCGTEHHGIAVATAIESIMQEYMNLY